MGMYLWYQSPSLHQWVRVNYKLFYFNFYAQYGLGIILCIIKEINCCEIGANVVLAKDTGNIQIQTNSYRKVV